ncbi:hypothetical protein APR12_001845 [Nocardia amikacinitolerans]|uniref:hypothetical protein n=1 Tax=Nocardia amikacinitolerans TaxID=756689 RepID=UPI000837A43F|nr:hypothetical protein [Nocardia amikacinitolerans]MCP2316508.1 hypothetical protein [Nocardia amikacinitolerans]
MATYKAVIPFRSFSLRTTTLIVGAISAAVVTAAPAIADAPPPGAAAPAGAVAEQFPFGANIFGAAIPLPIVPAIAPAPAADPVEPAPEAAVDVESEAATPVVEAAPVPAPTNVIRIGNVELGRPDWITPEQADQINGATMGAQNGLSGALQAAGMERSRSDQISADVIGTAAQGAVVGAAVSSPIAVVAAVMGAAIGLVVGIPFAPAGLAFMPVLAATLSVGMVSLPFIAAGAGLGAIVGAVEGSMAPPVAPPAEIPAA